jgi:hypothetical protein
MTGKKRAVVFGFGEGSGRGLMASQLMMRVRTAVHPRRHRECDVMVGKTGCKGSSSRRHEVSGGAVDRDVVGERGQGPISDI